MLMLYDMIQVEVIYSHLTLDSTVNPSHALPAPVVTRTGHSLQAVPCSGKLLSPAVCTRARARGSLGANFCYCSCALAAESAVSQEYGCSARSTPQTPRPADGYSNNLCQGGGKRRNWSNAIYLAGYEQPHTRFEVFEKCHINSDRVGIPVSCTTLRWKMRAWNTWHIACNVITKYQITTPRSYFHVLVKRSNTQVETTICSVAEKFVMQGQPIDATRLLLLASRLTRKV